jgi:D-alanyl-D-alanine carboxypeptidase/D-alanyl-D-alanine-endopeptidase (penicillin-binding protein 4)
VKRTLLKFCVLLTTATLAHANLKSEADTIIDKISPTTNIGIEVFDLNTGSTLYKRNENKNFIPASNMKLFSDAAALMVLGPDYRFKNQLSTSAASIQNGVLKGPLYLHLSGDPSFNNTRLSTLLSHLKTWNIHKIQGDVIIDSTNANISPYAPGIAIKDMTYSYGAPIAPLVIDANRLLVTVNPADRADQLAIVEIEENHGDIVITNQVRTKASSKNCGVDFVMDQNNHLTVRGCVGIGQWAVQQKMAIRNPLIYAQSLIQQQLNKSNIVLDGKVILGKAPTHAMLLASDSSKPIAQLMADTLKPSDNLYADSLFLHAAYKLQGSTANWDQAQVLVKNFLEKQTGINLKQAALTDGSGLSRNDLLTPSQTVELLKFLFQRFPLTFEYIAALPVSGRDGTLQKRFKKPLQQDMVRAKTGTMTGVISLSGYLYTANAHTLAFAIYINNPPKTPLSISGRYRYLVDALCGFFLQQKPANTSWATVFGSHPRIKYQFNPTQAEEQRKQQAKWRRLETVVKQSLKGQAVSVIYRNNELVLHDHQPDVSKVFTSLKNLGNKYPFALALFSPQVPTISGIPFVLWSESSIMPSEAKRVWIIRESII